MPVQHFAQYNSKLQLSSCSCYSENIKKQQPSMGSRQGARFAKVFKYVKTWGYLFTDVSRGPISHRSQGALGSHSSSLSVPPASVSLDTDRTGLTTPLNKICLLKASLITGLLSVCAFCNARSFLSHRTSDSI